MSSCSSSHYSTLSLCLCGLSPVLRTSWTDANPGRRFWGCSQRGCNFHLWHDPAVGDRAKNIIPGLLKRIQRLEDEIKRCRKKEKMLQSMLIGTFVVISVLVLCLLLFFIPCYCSWFNVMTTLRLICYVLVSFGFV
ncbi:hypothetical protein DCAR_0934568 [Daucus carota subsp. sativus]|uniref:GRF-type domain-containing protein n=1 Tax=Daucus carota subsp. sativus TaxID=79200 RepID=A0AAF1BD58_DAUCS|nr:hypothetical protein DCAR_0934568 [Daucus carota subsp. sativus]